MKRCIYWKPLKYIWISSYPMPTESLDCASAPSPETMIMAESGTAPNKGRTIPPDKRRISLRICVNFWFENQFSAVMWSKRTFDWPVTPTLFKPCKYPYSTECIKLTNSKCSVIPIRDGEQPRSNKSSAPSEKGMQ